MSLDIVLPNDPVWAVEPSAFGVWLSKLTPDAVEAAQHRSVPASPELMRVEQGVAVIPLEGVMMKRPTLFQAFFGGASTQLVQQAVEMAAADEAITAIVIRVDSPGGSGDGIAELSDAVFAAAERKMVVAHVSGMAASAALWAVAGADRIITGKLDMVGSIGTRMLLFDVSRMFENAGIKPVVIDTGEFKSTGAAGVPITDRQIEHLQSIVDTFFDEFVSAVSRGRGMTDAAVRAVADGRIFMPREALRLGLIDGIGTLDETVQALQSGRLPTGRGGGPRGAGKQLEAASPVRGPDGTKENNRMDPKKVTNIPAPAAPAAPAATDPAETNPGAQAPVVEMVALPMATTLPAAASAGIASRASGPPGSGAPPQGSGAGAGLRELKAALPNADANFLVDVSTRGLSVEQARDEWTAALEKRLAELKTKPSRSAPIGNATALTGNPVPYEHPAGADDGRMPSSAGDPTTEFDQRVRARVRDGSGRFDAVDAVKRDDPALYKQFLLATNPGRASQRCIEDKLETVGA